MLGWIKRLLPLPGQEQPLPTSPPVRNAAVAAAVAEFRAKGNACLDQGRPQDAEANYRSAAELDPADADAWTNLGFALNAQQRWAEAEAVLRQAVLVGPESHDACYILGTALRQQGKTAEAEAAFEASLTLQPGFWLCLRDLCLLQLETRNFAKAMHLAEAGIRLHPDHADFHYYLGTVLHEYRRFDEARASLERALALHPGYAHVHNNLGSALLELGSMDAAIDQYRKALAINPAYTDAHSNLLFALNYHPDLSAESIFSAYRDFDEALGVPLRQKWCEHDNDRGPQRRLRVGYVSPDFHQHSVRHFLEPLLAQHDAAAVEVFVYAEQRGEDDTTTRYRRLVDHWTATQGVSDDELCRRIRADRIDILVDLAGHTAGNRLGVFALRPAPVSVSWLGYGYTTGLSAIDHLLTDEVCAPAGCEALFAERPWRLLAPGFVYRPAQHMGDVGALPALRRGFVTFGTLTRSVRINHRCIRVWSEILRRVPGSRLVIDSRDFQEATACSALADKFAAWDIAPERLEFGFHSPPWDVLRGVDIGLDCFPHNSGTTLFEMLYMGVPFVTLAGRPSVGRLGSSVLHGAGHVQWIAHSEAEYVERAVGLAADKPALTTLRQRLRSRMEAGSLCNEAAFARKVEDAYRRMFLQWCNRQSQAVQTFAHWPRDDPRGDPEECSRN